MEDDENFDEIEDDGDEMFFCYCFVENGLYRVKALLEGTGSIPVYITLDAYRQILKEKERLNCSVSDTILKLFENQKQETAQQTA